jgi:dethiobiotin synthetase
MKWWRPAHTVCESTTVKVTEYVKSLATGFELKGAMRTASKTDWLALLKAAPVDKRRGSTSTASPSTPAAPPLDMDKSKDQLTNIKEILTAFPWHQAEDRWLHRQHR